MKIGKVNTPVQPSPWSSNNITQILSALSQLAHCLEKLNILLTSRPKLVFPALELYVIEIIYSSHSFLYFVFCLNSEFYPCDNISFSLLHNIPWYEHTTNIYQFYGSIYYVVYPLYWLFIIFRLGLFQIILWAFLTIYFNRKYVWNLLYTSS